MYYKAYKFRIYPDKVQKELINKTFGCSRFIYNHFLSKIKENKYTKASENIKDYTNHLKYEYPFLQEIDSIVIRKSLFNLEDSFKRYFQRQSNYPIFKSKFNRNSYNTTAVYGSYKNNNYCNIEIDLKNKTIKLPKLKNIKIRGYRNLKYINGKILNATISREPNGKYYVSVLYEMRKIIKEVTPVSLVGIDLGVKKDSYKLAEYTCDNWYKFHHFLLLY